MVILTSRDGLKIECKNGVTTMAKYLFVYHMSGAKPPTDPAEQKKAMDAWGAWFGSMGAAVIDGGNPVGKSSTVKPDGFDIILSGNFFDAKMTVANGPCQQSVTIVVEEGLPVKKISAVLKKC